MLVGVLIAAQLNFWQLNFNTSWLTWSRLRPLHTNAGIFAKGSWAKRSICGLRILSARQATEQKMEVATAKGEIPPFIYLELRLQPLVLFRKSLGQRP
jgi:cbb3-type cytochrome oxidase subunit 1